MDVTLLDLWLPILVAAAIVWFASALIWMVMPHHKKDIKKLPDGSAIPEQTRGLEPGLYMWPNCDHGDMKSEAFKQAYNAGPWGSLTVLPGKPSMLRNMGGVFAVYVVIGVFVGYVTSLARPAGAEFAEVFRVAGAVAMASYCLGWMPNALFFGKPGRFWLTDLFDCVIYALITGAAFAWLWPDATGVLDALAP